MALCNYIYLLTNKSKNLSQILNKATLHWFEELEQQQKTGMTGRFLLVSLFVTWMF